MKVCATVERCSFCGCAFLESDSRKAANPLPLCVTCEVNALEAAEASRIAEAAQALRSIAAIPAAWIARKRAR